MGDAFDAADKQEDENRSLKERIRKLEAEIKEKESRCDEIEQELFTQEKQVAQAKDEVRQMLPKAGTPPKGRRVTAGAGPTLYSFGVCVKIQLLLSPSCEIAREHQPGRNSAKRVLCTACSRSEALQRVVLMHYSISAALQSALEARHIMLPGGYSFDFQLFVFFFFSGTLG